MGTASSGPDPMPVVGVVAASRGDTMLARRLVNGGCTVCLLCPAHLRDQMAGVPVRIVASIPDMLDALGDKPVIWLSCARADVVVRIEEIFREEPHDVTVIIDSSDWAQRRVVSQLRNWEQIYEVALIAVQRIEGAFHLSYTETGQSYLRQATPVLEALR